MADAERSMDEQLKREMLSWLADAREAAHGAGDFLAGQAPDVVRDLIVLARVESTVMLVGSALMIGLLILAFRRTGRAIDGLPANSDADVPLVLLALLIGMAIIFLAIVFACNVHDFLASWFTPRVYVIEYLADLVGAASGGGD